MTQIAISGLSGGTSLTLLSGPDTPMVMGVLDNPPTPTPVSVYAMSDTQDRDCAPLSVTLADGWNGADFGAGFAPGVLSNFALVQQVQDGKVIVSGLDASATYAPAMYEGAEVEFRRVSDGQMTQVGTAQMAQVNFPLQWSFPGTLTSAIQGTTFRYQLDTWCRRGVSYWFAVSAVDAAGNIGSKSAWASCVIATGSSTITVATQATVTLSANRVAGGSLTSPSTPQLTQIDVLTVDLSWSAVSGAAGYIVHLAYSDPATWPTTAGEFVLTDLQGAQPQTGDMVIWRKEITQMTQAMFCARVDSASGAYVNLYPAFVSNARPGASTASWEVRSWAAEADIGTEEEKPSADLGRYYLRRTIPAGLQVTDGVFWSGGSGQTFYYHKKQGDVLVVDVWIRASENTTLRFTSGQPGESYQNFTVDTTWRQYRLRSDFSPAPSGTSVYQWRFLTATSQAELTLEYAQLRPYLEEAEFGALQPDLAQSIVPGQTIRDHNLIKTRPKSYTARIVTNPAGEGHMGSTCGMHMDMCRATETVPWVQLEWALFKEDWLIWADWLGANHADFDRILLELGNENWNGLAAFWTIPAMTDATTGATVPAGDVYGLMTKMVYEWLQESPAWSIIGDKIRMVIGGRIGSTYGELAYARCPAAQYVTIANYNGGWDVGTVKPEETGASFRNMLVFAGGSEQLDLRATALATVAQAHGHTVGTDVFHDLYEAGPGYQMNGLNGVSVSAEEAIVQECVVKSRAAATAQLDAICTAWTRGWLSNWFALANGDRWSSHSAAGVEYLTYAVGRVISASLGDFRAHDVHTLAMSTQDDLDDVAVHAFESVGTPGKWLFVALNRAIDPSVLTTGDALRDPADTGLRPVTIHTGFSTAQSCRVLRAGLGNMREHNRYPVGTRLTTAGSYVADPLCVTFDMGWQDTSLPADIDQLKIDTSLGIDTDGLRGGNFIMIELSGLVRG